MSTNEELSEFGLQLWTAASKAMEDGKYGYAVFVLKMLLREEPGFKAGEEMLYRAEERKRGTGGDL